VDAVVRIRLLGPPAIERDGDPAPPPRGRKAWALLAYLLLAERPASRRHLAELLFGEADDPLGALRWTLAELRRTLGAPRLFGGDPVATGLGDGISADVHALTGEPADPTGLLELDGELLDGLSVLASPTFESWLVVERHRLAATAEARLRQTALGLLAAGEAGAAVAYASRAVAHNPLDEGNHELLVRCLAASGDRAAALRQVAVCQDILRRELGIETSDALTEAAAAPAGSPRSRPASGRAAAWWRWAGRWSTPSAAATRRARSSSTRRSGWPPRPATPRPR
jgi:DNA-binding SARP family transcriptional activator